MIMKNSELFEEFRRIFFLGGLWTSKSTKMFTLYSYTLHFMFIMSMFSFGMETVSAYSEGANKFGFNLGGLLSMIVTLLKVEFTKTSKCQLLVHDIFDNEKYMNNGTKQELKESYSIERSTTTKLLKFYEYAMIITISSAILISTVLIAKYEIFGSGDDNYKPLFLPVWVPFNPMKNYVLVNILFVIITSVIGLVTCTVDFVVLCPIIYIIFRLRNLKYALRNMKKFSKYQNISFGDAHFGVLTQCMLEHQKIIQETVVCNSITKYIFFFDFLFHSTQIACFAVANIGNESLIDMKNALTFAALNYVFIQLLIVYWFGQTLMDESVEVSTAIYQSNWYTTDTKSRRFLWMMMARSQKSLGLAIGPFGIVNLKTFIQIVKTVYSIITILMRK